MQAKGKTVMYLPAEMMEIGEVSVAAKDKVNRSNASCTSKAITTVHRYLLAPVVKYLPHGSRRAAYETEIYGQR